MSITRGIIPPYINQAILRSYECELQQLYEDKPEGYLERDLQNFREDRLAEISLAARERIHRFLVQAQVVAFDKSFEDRRGAAALARLQGAAPIIDPQAVPHRPWRGILEPSPREVWNARTNALILSSQRALVSLDADAQSCFNIMGEVDEFFHKCCSLFPVNTPDHLMIGTIHSPRIINNACWDQTEGVVRFGGVDPRIYTSFVRTDIATHEFGHAIVQYGPNWIYEGQSGALNESIADTFAIMHAQWRGRQRAGDPDANWFVGRGIFAQNPNMALRSFEAPGEAFNNVRFPGGNIIEDTQTGHMNRYIHTEGDCGGVHANSGIPNHAFYQAAFRDQGVACERMGRIWQKALLEGGSEEDTFSSFALRTLAAANAYGEPVVDIVGRAWYASGVDLRGTPILGHFNEGTIALIENFPPRMTWTDGSFWRLCHALGYNAQIAAWTQGDRVRVETVTTPLLSGNCYFTNITRNSLTTGFKSRDIKIGYVPIGEARRIEDIIRGKIAVIQNLPPSMILTDGSRWKPCHALGWNIKIGSWKKGDDIEITKVDSTVQPGDYWFTNKTRGNYTQGYNWDHKRWS